MLNKLTDALFEFLVLSATGVCVACVVAMIAVIVYSVGSLF